MYIGKFYTAEFDQIEGFINLVIDVRKMNELYPNAREVKTFIPVQSFMSDQEDNEEEECQILQFPINNQI